MTACQNTHRRPLSVHMHLQTGPPLQQPGSIGLSGMQQPLMQQVCWGALAMLAAFLPVLWPA